MTARIAAICAALCLFGLVSAAPAHDDIRTSYASHALHANDGTPYTLHEGRMPVPDLHRDPVAPRDAFTLAWVRVQRGATPSRTAHVLLAGGPGDSGVAIVRRLAQAGGAPLLDLLGADLIGIDQRGSGASLPSLMVGVPFDLPLNPPASPAAWLPPMRQVVQQVAARLRAQGIRLEAFDTRESAHDVDLLRRALGYQSLVLWGRSYGSHLALAVLRQYPASVDRMILVGPEGPDHTWKLPLQADRVIERIAQLSGDAALVERLRTVIARLDARPVRVRVRDPDSGRPVPIRIGAFDLQWIAAHALGDARTLATFPAAVRRMEAGDFSAFAPLVLRFRRGAVLDSAMKYLMDATSGVSAARRAQIAAQEQASILGPALNFPALPLADAWGVHALDDEFRSAVVSAVPTLIFVAELDARTPRANADEIAATLSNAAIVDVANAAHRFDFFGSPAIRTVLHDFLRDRPLTLRRVETQPLSFAR